MSNWGKAVGNLHGWADGDEFYVNYVGHPMEGSVSGFIWVQNDRAYRNVEFGKDRLYWKSRLRAAAYAWAYSEQFEIGPLSEASLGAIQAYHPQQGFVDHVITPSIGLGWMIAEDAVDTYLIKRIEAYTGNRYIRMLVRSGLNPSRAFASVLQGAVPWTRQTRAGILSYDPHEERLLAALGVAGITPLKQARPEVPDVPGVAPFEFNLTFQLERLSAGSTSLPCVGGGGTFAVRMSSSWQFVTEVGGCKMVGPDKNLSGDSLNYMAGVRKSLIGTRWVAHVQFLAGGNKLTEERLYPDKKKAVEADPENLQPAAHMMYTDHAETNGFAISGGGGVSYKLNSALMLRVAELSCRHSWTNPMWGRDFRDSVKLSSGLVLRIGTW